MDIICMCTEDGKKRKIKCGRGERTEGGTWTGAHLINRLTFHSSLPYTALVAFWVASPSNSKIPASISLISFRIYTFLSGTWYLTSFCPYDYEHKYNPNNDLTLSKPSPGSPLLNFFFWLCFVFPIHLALGMHIFLMALIIWEYSINPPGWWYEHMSLSLLLWYEKFPDSN